MKIKSNLENKVLKYLEKNQSNKSSIPISEDNLQNIIITKDYFSKEESEKKNQFINIERDIIGFIEYSTEEIKKGILVPYNSYNNETNKIQKTIEKLNQGKHPKKWNVKNTYNTKLGGLLKYAGTEKIINAFEIERENETINLIFYTEKDLTKEDNTNICIKNAS